jgi:hypothetical protein
MAKQGISVDHSTAHHRVHQGVAGSGEGVSSPKVSRRSELANGRNTDKASPEQYPVDRVIQLNGIDGICPNDR